MIFEIGQRLGESLLRRMQASAAQPPGGRAPLGGAVCRVPRCGRGAVAKLLCGAHYRKARRLGLGDALTAAQLAALGQDARRSRGR